MRVIFCLLIRSANFSYGFLRKSGDAHYSMFRLQQNPPLAFGRTMLWTWLKRSCLQCTLQRALQAKHFSLAFSLLLLNADNMDIAQSNNSDFFRFRFSK